MLRKTGWRISSPPGAGGAESRCAGAETVQGSEGTARCESHGAGTQQGFASVATGSVQGDSSRQTIRCQPQAGWAISETAQISRTIGRMTPLIYDRCRPPAEVSRGPEFAVRSAQIGPFAPSVFRLPWRGNGPTTGSVPVLFRKSCGQETLGVIVLSVRPVPVPFVQPVRGSPMRHDDLRVIGTVIPNAAWATWLGPPEMAALPSAPAAALARARNVPRPQ